jgi:hypothetical protein
MPLRHHLISFPAEHENWGRCGDARELRGGVPFLEAEEGKGANEGPAAHDAREGLEGVFEDEGCGLRWR